MSKAGTNNGSRHGHVGSIMSLPGLRDGGEGGLFDCPTAGWTGEDVGLLMPEKVDVFLVTKAGLLTAGSFLGRVTRPESLGCTTGLVL